MPSSPSLVQPIILLVDKADPAGHRESILAAATASVRAYAAAADPAPWEAWLSGRFTKTVRRADAKTFARLASSQDYPAAAHAAVGKARALAFAPAAYEEMPKQILRLQVSGTDLQDTPFIAAAPAGPAIVLNGALGMSTGKAAAQAAHALFAWHLQHPATLDAPPSLEIVDDPDEFAARAAQATAPVIVDAGLTEIDPGTATAFVAASR